MKTSLILAVAALTISTGAYAGGLATTAVTPVASEAAKLTTDWAGPYVGAIVSNNTAESSTGDITSSEYPLNPLSGISYSSEGFSGGIEAGYNFQLNNIVYGVEVDASTASIDGQLANSVATGLGNNFSVSTTTNWIATARARVGFASGKALFYVTGGVAEANLDVNLTDVYNGGTTVYTPSVSETRNGIVKGAGAEFKLNQNWSVKAEYLHYDFGVQAEVFDEQVRTFSTDGTYTADQTRIGLNYRF